MPKRQSMTRARNRSKMLVNLLRKEPQTLKKKSLYLLFDLAYTVVIQSYVTYLVASTLATVDVCGLCCV